MSYYTIKKHDPATCTRDTAGQFLGMNILCGHEEDYCSCKFRCTNTFVVHELNLNQAIDVINNDAFVFYSFEDARRAALHLQLSDSDKTATFLSDGLFIPTHKDREYTTGFISVVAA